MNKEKILKIGIFLILIFTGILTGENWKQSEGGFDVGSFITVIIFVILLSYLLVKTEIKFFKSLLIIFPLYIASLVAIILSEQSIDGEMIGAPLLSIMPFIIIHSIIYNIFKLIRKYKN